MYDTIYNPADDSLLLAPIKIIIAMALQCGIVGLPNVGKSTLFNCLSNAKAQAANFPFCTIEPNIGVITVPDPRITKLADIVSPERVMPTTIEIVDIAGLVKGASQGEGLGNQFLGNIRETNAIIHVLRCFEDGNIIHVDGSVDPIRDKEVIDTELQLSDLESVEKLISKDIRGARAGDKKLADRVAVLERFKETLLTGVSARAVELSDAERESVADVQLLTIKPVLYVCNVNEDAVVAGNAHTEAVKAAVSQENAEVLILGVGIEADIAELESFEDKKEFLDDLGLEEAGVNRLIQSAYNLLQLETYFTAGEKEVRAWTIRKGTKAPAAAGVIHTDFEKGFIRAEVIHYEDYIQFGSESAVKEAGKLGVEGKEYVVQDGDVMHFRFNV
jgi:GTP-binding protein YchF